MEENKNPELENAGMKTVNVGLLVGIAVAAMIGVIALATWGSIGGASPYVTFNEAKSLEESVHVVGQWVNKEKAHYDVNQDLFTFYMMDSAKTVSKVHYHDPQPSNLGSAEQIVIEGQMKGEAFEADRILMKCPSKYNKGEFTIEEAEAS